MADATVASPGPREGLSDLVKQHWPILIGLAVVVAPTLLRLGQQVWSTETGAQGPIVFFTGLWLMWRKIPDLRREAVPGAPWLTALMLLGAFPLYVFGRTYDFVSLEVAGLYGFCLAILHAYVGVRAMLKIWFPLFYLAFLVPPPQWLMDSLTAPLKTFVSYLATSLLQFFDVPIYREGVTLIVAQYQLLVEDACSGMNSLTGLIAIGLFYIYLLRDASWRYSLFLVCLIIPIAILANMLRIIILVLLTYFFGDGIAQSFLHMTAGLFLFATALGLVFGIDHLISVFWRNRRVAA